ncbi:polysaccharide deacetylase family protein [Bacillus changyiensis]|uniref:polysaccharide deacetylase family protein n=1 Tax=Bacillus changyiensis TaxID=3004103 RepID=UPI0022E37120|nr:polysaccharide deacetylase family protein [Bacillus changyiensis]MDA1476905.1 polysaccharide deacetylase [Bacillus changyiensis]
MSNARKKSRKTNRMRKIVLGILTVLFITLGCISWDALAGSKSDSTRGNTTMLKHIFKDRKIGHQNSVGKKDPSKTPLETGKVVYLTFDDGPNPIASEKILSLLDKYNAKATFFMLKPHIEQNLDIVKKMVDRGHSVGSHGVTHQVSQIYKSPESFASEMNDTLAVINKATNSKSHLIRAPYGSKPYITAPFKAVIKRDHFNLWDWTVDSEDWKLANGAFVNNTIQQVNNLVDTRPLVVLMHEKPTTAAHLEKLLEYFQKNGYEMKALHDSMEPIQF